MKLADWQKDSSQIKTEMVQYWIKGAMITAQMPNKRAKELVESGSAFVISGQAISAIIEQHQSKEKAYYLIAQYYYFAGTLNAPRSGKININQDQYGTLEVETNPDVLIKFPSLVNAKEHLTECGYEHTGYGNWIIKGVYYLSHGEYAKPVIRIVKER